MTTSNVTNYSQTRNQVIYAALSLIGCNSEGITPSAADVSICNTFLNMMIKSWQTDGLHLWTKEVGTIFLKPFYSKHGLGGSTDRFTLSDTLVTTKLTSAVIAADTTINVITTIGMSVNDNVGIVQNDNSILWTTLDSVASATSVVLTAPVGVDINTNNHVYVYTEAASKPMRILSAKTLVGIDDHTAFSTQNEIPLTLIPYNTFTNFNSTSASSDVASSAMYSVENLTGSLYLFPRPTTAANRVQIVYERMIDVMLNVNNTFDFPDEWLEPLTFQLAVRLGTVFGAEAKAQVLMPIASYIYQKLLDWDCERLSLDIQPERS